MTRSRPGHLFAAAGPPRPTLRSRHWMRLATAGKDIRAMLADGDRNLASTSHLSEADGEDRWEDDGGRRR